MGRDFRARRGRGVVAVSAALSLWSVAPLLAAPGGGGWLYPTEPTVAPRPTPTATAAPPPATPAPDSRAPAPDDPDPRTEPARVARRRLPTSGPVWSLAFYPDGETLAAGQVGGVITRFALFGKPADDSRLRPKGGGRVLSLATQRLEPLAGEGPPAYRLVAGIQGATAPPGGGTRGWLFDEDTGETTAVPAPWGLAVSRGFYCSAYVTGRGEGVHEIPVGAMWDFSARRTPSPRRLAAGSPTHADLRMGADGSRLFAASGFDDRDFRVRVLSLKTGEEVAALRGHRAPVRAIALGPGDAAYSGSYDRRLLAFGRAGEAGWTAPRWEAAFAEDVNAVAADPRGRWVAAGIDDGTLALFDAADGRERARFPALTGHISALAVSPDGAWLATGGAPHEVRVFLVRDLLEPVEIR